MAHETVLVIEDEPAIRDLLRLHLGLAGFTIKEAGLPASASCMSAATVTASTLGERKVGLERAVI
jgi:DNA-binding response OmpR family regulator